MMDGRIRSLFITPERKAEAVSVQCAVASEVGFEGDYHSRARTKRQILIVSGSVLDEFELQPGALFENVTVDGMDVMQLVQGQQLELGEAVVEVTVPCEVCTQLERAKNGLTAALRHRRGLFVRVISPGFVRVGDSLRLFPSM